MTGGDPRLAVELVTWSSPFLFISLLSLWMIVNQLSSSSSLSTPTQASQPLSPPWSILWSCVVVDWLRSWKRDHLRPYFSVSVSGNDRQSSSSSSSWSSSSSLPQHDHHHNHRHSTDRVWSYFRCGEGRVISSDHICQLSVFVNDHPVYSLTMSVPFRFACPFFFCLSWDLAGWQWKDCLPLNTCP